MKAIVIGALVVCIAVFCGVVTATTTPLSESNIRSEFTRFTQLHNKQYATKMETEGRYQIFRANYLRAMELNAVTGENSHGITRFMDWTFEEKKAFLGYQRDYKARLAARHNVMPQPDTSKYNAKATPAPFDWRDKKAVSPVRDQGQCGSCWAYSATEQVESAMMMKYGNASDSRAWLSTQQTVACDRYDAGCRGGDTITAYRYMMSVAGIEAEVNYPYEAVTGTCKYNERLAYVKVSDWSWVIPACDNGSGDCSKQDEAAMAENMRAHGPASICVMVSDDWFSYTGPAPYKGSCTNNYYDLNHCVQVVGLGQQGSNTPYWIVRNSWGTSWGDNGYIYLPYGANTCGVADEVTMVTVA